MSKSNRIVMTIKVPSIKEMLHKVRGVPVPKSKIHRAKKGGGYHRPSEKRHRRHDHT